MSSAVVVERGFFPTAAAIWELGKPRITLMVLLTTLGGLWLSHAWSPGLVLWTLLGTALIVCGSNALNMYLERDSDALMRRTRDRPLPSGRMHPDVALFIGLGSAAIGVPVLTFGCNWLAGAIGAGSVILYVLAYTPLKRRSATALLVGAIPGAAPPLLGYVAGTGEITAGGLALFLILFLWQLPHFIAISLFRVDEYRAAGIKTVPGESGERRAKERIVIYSLLLVVVSLEAVRTGVSGGFYLGSALLLGGGLVTLSFFGLTADAGPRWARWYFFYTIVYLPILFLALVIGRR